LYLFTEKIFTATHQSNYDAMKKNFHIKSGSSGNAEILLSQQKSLGVLEQSKKRLSVNDEPSSPPEDERRITLVESKYVSDEQDDPERTLFNPKMELNMARSVYS
jgi:hypothetical protein